MCRSFTIRDASCGCCVSRGAAVHAVLGLVLLSLLCGWGCCISCGVNGVLRLLRLLYWWG